MNVLNELATKLIWLALAGGLIGALACGGSQNTDSATPIEEAVQDAPEPPPLDPMAMLPADSLAVATVNVGRVRTSPYYATIEEWLGLIPDLEPDMRQGLSEALQRIDLVHLAMVPKNCGAPCWTLGSIFFNGRLDEAEAEGLLRRVVVPDAARFERRDVEGRSAFGDDQGALVTLEPGSFLIGPFEHMRPALQQPQRPTHESVPAVSSALERLGPADVGVRGWVIGNEATRRMVTRQLPFPARAAQLVEGASYSLDIANGLQIQAWISTASPEAAAQLASMLQEQVRSLTSGLPARALGLHVIGQHTQIGAEGSAVNLRLDLPDAELRSLLERLGGFLQLAARVG